MSATTTDPVVVWLDTKSVDIPPEHMLPGAKIRHDRGTYYDVQPLIDRYDYPLISAGAYLHHRRRLAELMCKPIGLSAEAAFWIEYQVPGVWARRAVAADILLDSDVDFAYEWAADHCDPLGRWVPVARPGNLRSYLTRRRPYLDRVGVGSDLFDERGRCHPMVAADLSRWTDPYAQKRAVDWAAYRIRRRQ